jgi:hypothetical protein
MNNEIHIAFLERMVAHAQQVEADAVLLERRREALSRKLTDLQSERMRAKSFIPPGLPVNVIIQDVWKVSRL